MLLIGTSAFLIQDPGWKNSIRDKHPGYATQLARAPIPLQNKNLARSDRN